MSSKSRINQIVSAEAWQALVQDVEALGPEPDKDEVLALFVQKLWDTEGIYLGPREDS